MFIMNFSKIFKRNLVLLSSLSNFCSLMAFLRSTFQVNNLHFFNFCHLLEAAIKRFKDLIFTLGHILKILHKLRENIFIGKYTSFHNLDFIWTSLNRFLKFLDSCENCEHLEGESPSFWFHIVFLKHVDVLPI
jgi:hypothetical protein